MCGLLSKFHAGRRADTQDSLASARQRHFCHFGKLAGAPNGSCNGEFGSRSGGDPLRGLQNLPWPTGPWTEGGWTAVPMKGREDVVGPSSLGTSLLISVVLDGSDTGFPLVLQDGFVTLHFR